MVVVGDKRQFLSCLIVPNLELVQEFAASAGIARVSNSDLLKQPVVQELFAGILSQMNQDLPGFSKIREFTLVEHEFTLEGGELTPTMKVKRFAINRKYKAEIDAMYPAPLPGEDNE